MVLLYALTLPSSMSLIHKHRKYHYSYRTSLEDVMGFSLARALLLSFAYAWGAKRHQHRCADHCCRLHVALPNGLAGGCCMHSITAGMGLLRCCSQRSSPSARFDRCCIHPRRQYLMTAYMLGGAGLIYLAVKASLFTYGEGRVPVAVLLSTFGVFSILHIYAAR